VTQDDAILIDELMGRLDKMVLACDALLKIAQERALQIEELYQRAACHSTVGSFTTDVAFPARALRGGDGILR
jgi:hypothetical protein